MRRKRERVPQLGIGAQGVGHTGGAHMPGVAHIAGAHIPGVAHIAGVHILGVAHIAAGVSQILGRQLHKLRLGLHRSLILKLSGSSIDSALLVSQLGKLYFLIRCKRLFSTNPSRLSVANEK